MAYQLEWAPREEGILSGFPIGVTPSTIANKPKLHAWLNWYYDAFWIIDSGRPIYQGSVGRIPLTEMLAYLALIGLDEIEDRQLFVKMMRGLDSIYVKIVNAEIQRKIAVDRADAERERERNS